MGSINETRLDKTQHTGERGDTPTLLLKTGVGLVVVGIGRRFNRKALSLLAGFRNFLRLRCSGRVEASDKTYTAVGASIKAGPRVTSAVGA